MPAEKYIGTLLMIHGKQRRVIGKCTFADFTAMSGVSRDYMADTGNEHECAWLDVLPAGVLYYFENEGHPEIKPLPVPETQIRYRSAKDKKETLKRQADEKEARIAESRAKWADAADRKREEAIERVASKLYEFDRANLPWEEAGEDVKALYRGRAVEVIALI